jgi:predicted metal-binding membrane protein
MQPLQFHSSIDCKTKRIFKQGMAPERLPGCAVKCHHLLIGRARAMATQDIDDEPRAPAIQAVPASRPLPRRSPWRRAVVTCALLALSMLSWGYLLVHVLKLVPASMPWLAHTALLRQPALPYQGAQVLLVQVMWTMVMAAVMLPSAAPLVLLFLNVCRLHHLVRFPLFATAVFTLAILVAWSGFAVLATLLQWALHDTGVLDRSGALASSTASGLALVAAGVYQWTPLKHRSLDHCRSPLSFVLTGWRPGPLGAFRMGVSHALHCLGCWGALLLLLLIVCGPMNMAAIAGLAVLVAAEKLLPKGVILACVGGLLLVAWGTYALFP